MGKLHKIRRLLRKPEERRKVQNFARGTFGGNHSAVHIWYGNRHRDYIKKILRGYSAL